MATKTPSHLFIVSLSPLLSGSFFFSSCLLISFKSFEVTRSPAIVAFSSLLYFGLCLPSSWLTISALRLRHFSAQDPTHRRQPVNFSWMKDQVGHLVWRVLAKGKIAQWKQFSEKIQRNPDVAGWGLSTKESWDSWVQRKKNYIASRALTVRQKHTQLTPKQEQLQLN